VIGYCFSLVVVSLVPLEVEYELEEAHMFRNMLWYTSLALNGGCCRIYYPVGNDSCCRHGACACDCGAGLGKILLEDMPVRE